MGVTGIGGVFFRSSDPEALAAWYAEHLGIGPHLWETQSGPCVFAPFRETSDYFAADRRWMLNLRVDDLDALDKAEQAALARRVVLREMGVMTIGTLLIVTLALRAGASAGGFGI